MYTLNDRPQVMTISIQETAKAGDIIELKFKEKVFATYQCIKTDNTITSSLRFIERSPVTRSEQQTENK